MIQNFVSVMEWVAFAIYVFGLSLLVLGAARGAVGWVRTELGREPWDVRIVSVRKLRCIVGVHILYALELMIVADVIATFVVVAGRKTSVESFFHSEVFSALMELGIIVLIRTILDYFVGKEIRELRADAP